MTPGAHRVLSLAAAALARRRIGDCAGSDALCDSGADSGGIGGMPRCRSGFRSRPRGTTRRRRSRRRVRQFAARQDAYVGRRVWGQLPRQHKHRQWRQRYERPRSIHGQKLPEHPQVLGGYSLGAEVADLVTGGRPGFGFTNPLPPGIDQHVAAVALFGNGTRGSAPAFAGKTIDQCAPGDPICGRGMNWPSHLQPSYIDSGLVDQAASFVAGRL